MANLFRVQNLTKADNITNSQNIKTCQLMFKVMADMSDIENAITGEAIMKGSNQDHMEPSNVMKV